MQDEYSYDGGDNTPRQSSYKDSPEYGTSESHIEYPESTEPTQVPQPPGSFFTLFKQSFPEGDSAWAPKLTPVEDEFSINLGIASVDEGAKPDETGAEVA